MRQRCLLTLAFALIAAPVTAQQQATSSDTAQPAGMPTSGGYKPPSLSLDSLMDSDKDLQAAMMRFAGSGDRGAFRNFIETKAASGNIGAELLLGEQYIPEQCTFEPDQDVPHCGKDGNEPPKVVFRSNPLNVPASYEEAAHWLEHASAQGSGEASEVLAQLITRMLANGHVTTYTAADSTQLHALARSQGFDVEPISVTCFQLDSAPGGLTIGRAPALVAGKPPAQPFSSEQLTALQALGTSGTLRYQGGSGAGDSVLLMRPEGPPVSIHIILDHDPGHEIHLPIPAHRSVIYVQRGDSFSAIPSDGANLPRFISIMPQRADMRQVSVFAQPMDGGFSGGFCARF